MRAIASAIAAVALLVGIAGPASAGATLDKIISQKKMVVGTAPGWPRFMIWDPKTNRHEGLIADDIRNFEAETGIKVEIVNTTWAGMVAGLQAGTYDVIMSGIGATPERAVALAFSEPWGFLATTIQLKSDSPVTSARQLDEAGKVISTVSGTAAHKFALKFFKKAKVTGFSDTATALLDVAQGRADAYVGDSVSNFVRAQERPSEFKLLQFDPKDAEWNSMNHAVRYGDLDVLAFINTYIQSMRLRGWYQKIVEKHGLPPELATGPR